MSYLNSMSITITKDDLDEISFSYYPAMTDKINVMLGDIALWFKSYDDFKKFSLAIQSGFEKTLSSSVAKAMERLVKEVS